MAIVDGQGRLFGRWNLLDVAVAVLIAGLIPLGYAAFVLFRDRPPRLVSVTPNQIQQAREFKISVKGENLRPYMRVSIGLRQGSDFIFNSTEDADGPFPSIPPGTYDVVLFDQSQERFRLPNAITITPSGVPATDVAVVGAFGNLDTAGAAKLTVGTKLGEIGEIVAVGSPVPDRTEIFSGARVIGVDGRDRLQLPAVIKLTCNIQAQQGTPYCTSDDVNLQPRMLLTLPSPLGKTPFQIQRVRGLQPIEAVRLSMTLRGPTAVIARVKPGDIDNGGFDNPLGVLARIDSVGAIRATGAGTSEVDIKAVANMQRINNGWFYDSAPLRVGSPLTLKTAVYEAAGVVTDIAAP